jgi:hypothetical protein
LAIVTIPERLAQDGAGNRKARVSRGRISSAK